MKKRHIIFFLFLAVLFPWNVLGEKSVSVESHSTAEIQAADANTTTSSHPFGKARSLAAHTNTTGEISLNPISCCSTIYDSKEDAFDEALVEEIVQRYAAILMTIFDSIEIGLATRILIFPFHFFF